VSARLALELSREPLRRVLAGAEPQGVGTQVRTALGAASSSAATRPRTREGFREYRHPGEPMKEQEEEEGRGAGPGARAGAEEGEGRGGRGAEWGLPGSREVIRRTSQPKPWDMVDTYASSC